jgi:hypothetical protein
MAVHVTQQDNEPAPRDLRIVGKNEDCAVAVLDNCVFLYWRRRIIPEGSTWARRAFLDVRRDSPSEKIVFFTVVDAACSLDTPAEVRKEIAGILKAYETQLAAAAITFEGSGFKMTMVRSVITAIYIASRTQFPNSVFGAVEAAATWTSSFSRSNPASTLISAVNALRQ